MSENGYKECPYCGEEVKTQAIKCKHCHSVLNNGNDKELRIPGTPVATTHKRSNAWLKTVLIVVGVLAVVTIAVLMLNFVPVREDTAAMSEEDYVAELSEHLGEFLSSLYTLFYSMPTNLEISKELMVRIDTPANKILTLSVPQAFQSGHEDIATVIELADEFCSIHLRAVENVDATVYDNYDGSESGRNMGAKLNSGLTKMATAVRDSNPELAEEIDSLLKDLTNIADTDPNNLSMNAWLEASMWVVDLSNKTQNINLLPEEYVTGVPKEDIEILRDAISEVRYLNPPLTLARSYYHDYLPAVLEFEKYVDAMEEGKPFIALEHAGNAIGMSYMKGMPQAIIEMFEYLDDIKPEEN